ncbi:MAG: hypothetical protein IMZ61_06465 [Planctomycetes bacterium]|nr:hypothetical protein [Planctomycetota bacterium]
MVNWNTVNVKEGNREMNVLIPDTGDSLETQDITEAAIEKTKDELRHNQRPVSTVKPEDRRAALREFQERKEHKRNGTRKFY